MGSKKKSLGDLVFKLADLEAEIDIIKNNRKDFDPKELKSLQNKMYRVKKQIEDIDEGKVESLNEDANDGPIKQKLLSLANESSSKDDFFGYADDEAQWNELDEDTKIEAYIQYYDLIDIVHDKLHLPTYMGLLELSDRRVLFDIVDDIEIDKGMYQEEVERWLDKFSEDHNVELFVEGRNGRHICIEINLENIYRFKELQKAYKEYEQEFINDINKLYSQEEPDEYQSDIELDMRKTQDFIDDHNESLEIRNKSSLLKEAKSKGLSFNRKFGKSQEEAKKFNLTKIDQAKDIGKFYNDKDIVIEGVDISDSNMDELVNRLNVFKLAKTTPVPVYVIKGKTMNNMFALNDDESYKPNQNLVVIKISDLADNKAGLKDFKFNVGANTIYNAINNRSGMNRSQLKKIFNTDSIETVEPQSIIEEPVEKVEPLKESLQLNELEIPLYIKTNKGYMELDLCKNPEKPEEYNEGYITGWNKGEDEEFDKKQEEKFEKATEAYENGEVYQLVDLTDDTIYSIMYGENEVNEMLKQLDATKVDIKELLSND